MTPVEKLGTGEVGYVIANIRRLSDVTIGDTITDAANPTKNPISGIFVGTTVTALLQSSSVVILMLLSLNVHCYPSHLPQNA